MSSRTIESRVTEKEKKQEMLAMKAFERSERRLGYMLISPTVIAMGVMILFPFISAIWLSFHRKSPISPKTTFIGFENYAYIFKNEEFWQSFLNNVIWTGSCVGLELIIGIALGLLMHQKFKGRAVVRGLVLFPYMIPSVVACLVWQWLFNDLYGVVNHFLRSIGLLESSIIWLGHPFWAMVSCILVTVWSRTPFIIIVVLARLQTIPEELYEAAQIDGATSIQRFLTITLPQLRSVLIIAILLRSLWTYKNFDIIWLLTRGGPLYSTQTLPIYGYKEAFLSMFMGRGASISVTIFLTLAIFSFLFLYLMRKQETS